MCGEEENQTGICYLTSIDFFNWQLTILKFIFFGQIISSIERFVVLLEIHFLCEKKRRKVIF